MPTYEYECEGCGGHFEYFQRMSEKPKTKCERCGGHLRRLVGSGGGIIFKGSGFYITDYKRSHSSGGGSSSPSSSSPSGGSSEGAGSSETGKSGKSE
jgi:putative FmdB family regulatory protein